MLYVPLVQFRYDSYGNRSPVGEVHAFPTGQVYQRTLKNREVIQSACGLYEFPFGDWSWELPEESTGAEVCKECERAFILSELGE